MLFEVLQETEKVKEKWWHGATDYEWFWIYKWALLLGSNRLDGFERFRFHTETVSLLA